MTVQTLIVILVVIINIIFWSRAMKYWQLAAMTEDMKKDYWEGVAQKGNPPWYTMFAMSLLVVVVLVVGVAAFH
jgi:hypothetical protein